MSRSKRIFAFVLGLSFPIFLRADPGPMSIWFTNAAAVGNSNAWYQESLPIGNGKLAAMVYGGVGTEQIQFNEDTIWTGQPHDYSHPNAASYLAGMQSNIFNIPSGQSAFWTTCSVNFMSLPLREPAYQPAGTLNLTFPHSGLSNYKRSLDLSNATANVKYDFGGVSYSRDYFASAPSNKVIVIRLTASQAAKITFTATFATHESGTFSTSGNDLVMHANVINKGDPGYYNTGLTNAVRYDARLRVLAEGGTVTTTSSSISVTNADAVTLLLAVASNVINYNDVSADYATICSNNIAAAALNSYAVLRQAQQDDYKSIFNRVVLDLGTTAKVNQPIGVRKRTITAGDDPQLITLAFQLGRYLIISGSRPGSQALNLQGKWNDATVPSWDSKMTLNINEEMNYWGAELANLSECHLPLFDMISDLSVSGARCAKTNYNADGWVVHHNTDLWRAAAPVNGKDGVWPTGGAWLCQHLWWHYQYTGDTNFLATTAYPLMKSAAQFFEDFLIPHKTNANWLVTNPSYSPEHDQPGNGPNVAGPTMDNDLLRDLFKHVIEATQILGVDATFRTNIMTIKDKLPPDQVLSGGMLAEWLNGGDDPGHRHCSHLVGLFPGDEISPFYTPVIAQAAMVSVKNRGPGITGAGRIGWGQAWRVNLRNRLFDGEDAYLVLTNLIFDSTLSTNLVFSNGANRQMDCIYGTLSGIGEMFLQSHSGEITLLPALPNTFTNGSVSGLCARGAFVVDIQWQSNKLASANIFSKIGNTCRLRSRWPIDVKLGANYVDAPMILPGLYQFTTVAGSNYTILPATVYETESLATNSASVGDTHQGLTNAAFSNWRGTKFNANAAADFVSYALSNVVAGTYRVRVVADAGNDRGQFQLLCGPVGGTLANVGSVQDAYSVTNLAYLLPLRIGTPTNVLSLWTNQLTEYDCGTWQAPSNGNYQFTFTVAGKNAASSGYNLSFDYIKFTPAVVAPPSNSAPTDISLPTSSGVENQPAGMTVGMFGTTDPDAGNTFSYALVSGTGDTNNALFAISSNALLTAASFDFEAQNSYSIRVRSTDQGGLFFEKAFAVTIVNTNETPTDLSLLNVSVTENQPPGTAVGALGTTDPDAGNTFTYTLVSGAGDTNNAAFNIDGDTLQTVAAIDFETQNSFSIRVRSTDQGGLYFEKAFTITAVDTNEPPVGISLSNSSAPENQPSGTTVGTLGATDPDTGNTFTFSLVGGDGDTNNAAFTMSSNALQTAVPFDFETQANCGVRVRVTDQGGLFFEKTFVIAIVDTNEAPATPTNLAPVDATVSQSLTVTLQTSGFNDPDTGDTNAASQWLVRRVMDNTIVFDSGTNVTDKTSIALPTGALDFATSYNWQARHEDGHGLWSDYSTPTTFSTLAPMLNLIEQGGELRLVWPTNTPGFQLELATELPSSNWFPASPPPVIVDGQNVVTNVHSGEKTFYRLNRP